jgi:hypothetical protein
LAFSGVFCPVFPLSETAFGPARIKSLRRDRPRWDYEVELTHAPLANGKFAVAYLALYRGMTTRKATDHIIRIRAVAVDNAEKLKYLESPTFISTNDIEETAGKGK